MRTFLSILLTLIATCSWAEGAPQGLWDRVTGAIGNGYDYARGAISNGYDFTRGAVQGTGDMYRAYSDMRDANWVNSDKYFHARGNYDAAQRGPGGRWAAEVISNAREWTDQLRGGSAEASASDQAANQWGRNGGDPNVYRPAGLPDNY